MPLNAGVQVRIVGRIHGQQTVNVLNFGTETPFVRDTVVPDLTQIATFVLECVVETLLPAITQDWTLEHVAAKHIYPETTDEVVVVPPGDRVGTQGPASHSFACSLMQIRTGGGGRSGRGRNFLPPCGEAQTTASNIDGPTLIFLAQFLACMTGKFVGANATTAWRLGVFSRKKFGGIFANFENSFRPATTLSVSPLAAIMGTRKVGRGA